MSLFSRLFPGLENCWTNFKTFSRIQDSVRNLLEKRPPYWLLWVSEWDWVRVSPNCIMGLFWGCYRFFYWLLQGCVGNWDKTRSPKESHNAFRHKTKTGLFYYILQTTDWQTTHYNAKTNIQTKNKETQQQVAIAVRLLKSTCIYNKQRLSHIITKRGIHSLNNYIKKLNIFYLHLFRFVTACINFSWSTTRSIIGVRFFCSFGERVATIGIPWSRGLSTKKGKPKATTFIHIQEMSIITAHCDALCHL